MQANCTMNNEIGFESSKPGWPDGYVLRHGCQMAWPDVHVVTCAHPKDMEIIYLYTFICFCHS